MADLKKGSTLGGIPIVTTDMISKILEDSGAENIGNKIDKINTTVLTTVSEIDSIPVDMNKNGFYKYFGEAINVPSPTTSSFTEGSIFNLSTDTAKGLIQFFSPPSTASYGKGDGELYYRNNASSRWSLLVNNGFLNERLLSYLPKSGGRIDGILNINGFLDSTGNISSTNGYLRSTSNGNTVQIGSINNSCCHFTNTANIPFYFNNDVKVQGEIYAGINYNSKVWHSGNFNPSAYSILSTQLANAYDLNTLIAEGSYRVYQANNRPSKILNWAYIEVLRHNDNYVLQKIYNFEGTLSYMRTKSNGTWTEWIPMGGGMTYNKTIATTTEWTLSNNMYEMIITHNLGSENIVSVVLTDSSKYSMNTGFQTIDQNKVKIFCGENVTGKVVINATV